MTLFQFFKFRHWIRIHDVVLDNGRAFAGQDDRYLFEKAVPPSRSFALVEGYYSFSGPTVTRVVRAIRTPCHYKYNTADPEALPNILLESGGRDITSWVELKE